MTELVACLSTGKGTWGQVVKLIASHDWDKVILITNEFGKENFSIEAEMEFIVVNSKQSMEILINEIKTQLAEKVAGTQVALNLISGTGKEHMALVSALLKLGLGIRLVAVTEEGMKEL